MSQDQNLSQKPVAEIVRPEITRLPELTLSRRFIRRVLICLVKITVRLFTKVKVSGIENIPLQGPILVVTNHLGDADLLIGVAITPRAIETFVKSELRDYPVLGQFLEAFGVIWIHRGYQDRRAIRVALRALSEGRMLGIAPEGRESLTGALEEGTNGAAYLALKANVPILPVTFTGTENHQIFPNIKRLRRTHVTVTIGQPFILPSHESPRTAISKGTETIMYKLASQLPIDYQGVYQMSDEVCKEPASNTEKGNSHGRG